MKMQTAVMSAALVVMCALAGGTAAARAARVGSLLDLEEYHTDGDPGALFAALALDDDDSNTPGETPPLDFLIPPEIWSLPQFSSIDNSLKMELTPSQRLYLQSLPSLLPHFNSSCTCEHRKCSCCARMEVTRLHRNHTSCVSLIYNRKRLAVTLKLSLNNFTIVEKDLFSGSNPPPFCLPIPQLPFISVCLRLSNVSLTDDARLQGCASVEAGVVLIPPLIRFRFGCLVVGPGGASWTSEPTLSTIDTQAQAAMQQFAAALNSTEKEQFLLLQSILRQQSSPSNKQRMLWP